MVDMVELFSRDPAKLTDKDIEEIIRIQRENRKHFVLGKMQKPKEKKKTKTEELLGKFDLSKFKV